MRLIKCIIGLSLATLSLSSYAATATPWQIVSGKSLLNFTATQNNAPVAGQFKNISGNIQFDPTQLDSSQVQIIVDSNSLAVPYKELLDTIKAQDWLDVKDFPKAEFKSTKITKISDNHYQADGKLTIRNKTLPLSVKFNTENPSPKELIITGTTQVKRTDFGVGQGEWASTTEVQDNVKIDFKLDLMPLMK